MIGYKEWKYFFIACNREGGLYVFLHKARLRLFGIDLY